MAGIIGLGGVAALGAGYLAHPAVELILGGWKRDMGYSGLFNTPNLQPRPEAAVEAWYRGGLSDRDLAFCLRSNGIYADADLLKEASYDIVSKGYHRLGQLWSGVLGTLQPHVSIIEALSLANRDKKYLPNLDNVLTLEGFKSDEQKEMVKEFLKEIPGPSDLVHFTLRHGFEPDVIRQYREDEEFPKTSKEWFAKQGLAYPISITSPIDGKTYTTNRDGSPITWADLHWWTHWVPISPSQAYDMLHRIREDNREEWSAIAPNAIPYTLADVRRWLRVNDYPPGVRDNLVALSYAPLGRVDIRRMYNVGTLAFEQLQGQYQNLGYAPDKAKLLADFTRKQKDLAQIKPVAEATKSKVISLYESGAIARPQAAAQLFRLMILDPDKLDEYDTFPEAAQIAVAADNDYVNATLSFVDLEIKEKRLNRYLKIYKRSFMLGDLSAAVLEMNLQALMMQQWRIDQLVDEWSTELTSLRIPAATRKILEWAKQGLITLNDLDSRLSNLHYSAVDRGLFTAEVVKFVTDRQLKLTAEQQKAADKLAVQQARDAARQAKAAAALAEKRQKAGEVAAAKAAAERRRILIAADRLVTEKNIRSWWKDKLIDAEWVRARFTQLAVNPADIEMFIQELGPQS